MTTPSKTSAPTAHDESLTTPRDTSSPLLSFIMDSPPDPGSVTEVADGVFWLRFPLPMKGLNHINLWAIKDGDSWVVVDTGVGNRESKDIWKKHFTGLMGARPVNRIICTHLHPDHSGLAGWICRQFEAPLLMTRGEYFLCRLMAADTGQAAPREGLRFYKKAGYTDAQLELYKARFGGFGKAITPMPHSYDRIEQDDIIKIGGRDWHVIIGSGHSPEHACLWCPELSLVLSGDQILPNISSNVSVWPTEPESNPLGEWIASCEKLRDILPPDTLVCPAHGIPFRGAHARLSKLILHHEKALTRLYDYCATPRLSTEVYPVLFRRAITDGNRIMAVGESIAHLNCLKERGMVTRRLNDAGQFSYKSRPPHKIPGYIKEAAE